MRSHPDVAVVLLDVIMETDTAGLDLVEFIREDLKNETVRIILRTGQPGQAPERRVIVDYDINDYKAKTELTADKLFTALTAALRSYLQLQRMVETRRGLEIIIEAASARCSTSSRCSGWRKACSPRSPRCSTSIAPAFSCCARPDTRRRASRSSPGPAATAGSSARTCRKSLIEQTCGARAGGVHAPPPRVFPPALGSLHPDAQRPRGRRGAGGGTPAFGYRPRTGRDFLQPTFDRIRQRHSLRAAPASQCRGWRSAWPSVPRT